MIDFNRHGYGTLKDRSGGVIYQGFWENNKYNGNGILFNANAPQSMSQTLNHMDLSDMDKYWKKYDGIFREGFKEGQGIMYFCNSEKYLGQFFRDHIHGEGIYIKNNAQVIKGYWQYNKLVKLL